MKRLRPYFPILWAFTLNLVILGCRVVRQVVLPGRKRTGNLLSSLFLLFAGVTDQLISFRQAVLRVAPFYNKKIPAQERLQAAWRYSKKYLRQGMLVAGWVLFILSSLEWAHPGHSATSPIDPQPSATTTGALPTTTGARSTITTGTRVLLLSVPTPNDPTAAIRLATQDEHTAFPHPLPASKRWILLCTFRI